MRAPAWILPAAIIAAFYLLRRSSADAAFQDQGEGLFFPVDPNQPAPAPAVDADILGNLYASAEDRMQAFLYMIRCCEHVYPRDVINDACYSIFYGGSIFTSFADHPVNTGEKQGVPLPEAMCRAAGLNTGCVSTAAGAYQFIRPTWNRLRAMQPRLPDFSPASQDAAARRLLRELGAEAAVLNGDFPEALRLASRAWASLPGSSAGQGQRSVEFCRRVYGEGLLKAVA